MSTQSHNLYTKDGLRKLAEDAGLEVPSQPSPIMNLGEQMEAAMAEVNETIESAKDTAEHVVARLEANGVYFIAGFICGMAAMVIARLIN